jgi:ubiquinone/menaquinone biosynthesis C-methylase UbiE
VDLRLSGSGRAPGLSGSARRLILALVVRAFAASLRMSTAMERRGWVESDQPLWRSFEDSVRGALAEVPDGGVFVDVGGGRNCVYADAVPRERGVELVSVDISAEELAHNAVADRTVVANIAESIPFADAEVDLLVSRVVLEHVDGVPGAIGHMARVVKPGGRTIHFVPGRFATFAIAARLLPFKPLLRLLHFAVPGSVGVVEFDVHYDRTDPVALERLFREAGFRDVRVTWTAAQADYYKTFAPAYLLIVAYQTLVRALGLRRLAAYVVVDARR